MTVQPSPYAILQAIQDQQRATDRLIAMLAGMLDKSAPDPISQMPLPSYRHGLLDGSIKADPGLAGKAMAERIKALKLEPAPAWTPREKPRSNRPMRRIEIGGVPVLMSEARAGMVDALREKPCTTEDIVALGLSVSMDAVRKSFGCMNDEFEKLGIRHRIKPIERLSRVGPKGGSILPRYALVDPAEEFAAPGLSTAVQSEAAAGASPGEGASDSAARDGETASSAQDASFAMPSGEGGTSRVDPSPAADAKPKMNPGDNVGRDSVLDLWRDTDLSKLDIARQIGISRATVVAILTDARANLEPRVIAGDQTRIAAKDAAPIPRSDDALPIVPASPPAASTRPLAGPLEGKPILPRPVNGALTIEPGDLLAVDIKAKRVQTARGAYEVGGANLARALDFMKGGHLFGLDVIAKRAGWPTADVAKTALGFEKNRLAQHGIDLYLDKHNARLRAAE